MNNPITNGLERVGIRTREVVEEVGYLSSLFFECLYWLVRGHSRHQPVSLQSSFRQMTRVGVSAIPLVALLAFGVGVMLAVQGIHTLRTFGAESQVVIGIALSVTREFAALIVGILLAGRTGSALAARIGTMVVNQEIDALRVLGISPVRYLVVPPLLALAIMTPALTILADGMALLGGAVLTSAELGLSYSAFWQEAIKVLEVQDVMQGVVKAVVFGIIVAVVGAAKGFMASGGAEGVGRLTTEAVVLSIAGIVMTDMLFTFFMTRL